MWKLRTLGKHIISSSTLASPLRSPNRSISHSVLSSPTNWESSHNNLFNSCHRGFHSSLICGYEEEYESGPIQIKGRDSRKMSRRRREEDDENADEWRKKKNNKVKKVQIIPKLIYLDVETSVSEIAAQSGEKFEDFLKRMHKKTGDYSYQANTMLSYEDASLIIEELGHHSEQLAFTQEQLKRAIPDDPSIFPHRPPVVTILGHVDHGKTSLLDYLRNSAVAAQEAGGITQHIGAFAVQTSMGSITFLDTPGHEAFTDMRARGAACTDIVVLVVAATEGCQAQTREAIQHAKDAGVPVVVAINKIDMPGADVEKTKLSLMSAGLELEDNGGDVQVIPISARFGTNVGDLEEAIMAQADMLDLRGDPSGPAEGVIIESHVAQGVGVSASALITRGTLKKGAFILAGDHYGKVKTILDEQRRNMKEGAGPSVACHITGWDSLPPAGSLIVQMSSEKLARLTVAKRKKQANMIDFFVRRNEGKKTDSTPDESEKRVNVPFRTVRQKKNELRERLANENWEKVEQREEHFVDDEEYVPAPKISLPIVLRGDVEGTVDALKKALQGFGNRKIGNTVISSGVGTVTASDIEMASTAKGVIIAFNAPTSHAIQQMAMKNNVPLIASKVIYHILDEVKSEMSSKLPPLKTRRIEGTATVNETFQLRNKSSNVVAGCRVDDGSLKKKLHFRVRRKQKTLWQGKSADEIRHHKDITNIVKKGMDCGIRLPGFNEYAVGDKIECYDIVYETQEFDPEDN
eukprot:CFRG8106T1